MLSKLLQPFPVPAMLIIKISLIAIRGGINILFLPFSTPSPFKEKEIDLLLTRFNVFFREWAVNLELLPKYSSGL